MGNACNGCFAGLTSSNLNPKENQNFFPETTNVRDNKALANACQKGNLEQVAFIGNPMSNRISIIRKSFFRKSWS